MISVVAGFVLSTFVFRFATAGPTIGICSAVLFGASLLKKAG